MKKLCIKLILPVLILLLFWLTNFYANAQEVEWLAIAPKLTTGEVEHTNRRINFLWSNPWELRRNYHKAHEDLTFRERIFSWIIEVDDMMEYIVHVIKFLGELWIVVWAIFIMYAGYKYMLSVFNWWNTPSSTLKNAIIWVIIVIFSYAIMKILLSIIWLA